MICKKLQWAIAEIMNFVKPDYFGKITLTFQNGKVSHIEFQKTVVPPKE